MLVGDIGGSIGWGWWWGGVGSGVSGGAGVSVLCYNVICFCMRMLIRSFCIICKMKMNRNGKNFNSDNCHNSFDNCQIVKPVILHLYPFMFDY